MFHIGSGRTAMVFVAAEAGHEWHAMRDREALCGRPAGQPWAGAELPPIEGWCRNCVHLAALAERAAWLEEALADVVGALREAAGRLAAYGGDQPAERYRAQAQAFEQVGTIHESGRLGRSTARTSLPAVVAAER
jgi:hypothetical protein